jgi:hypothetical protein
MRSCCILLVDSVKKKMLKVFENRVLREIFGPIKKEVTGD